MELLTDGTESNELLGFCVGVISRHAENWPPSEQALADEFVSWFDAKSLLTKTGMQKLCLSKGIKLSFVPLPPELHGFNCSFGKTNEIVITDDEIVPFAHTHTLFHEFREMFERVFVELGHGTVAPRESLEATAEEFAMAARMATATRELPAYFTMVGNIEKNWARYFSYVALFAFFVSYMFSCAFLPQFENMMSEARRQRYVRT